MAFAKRIILFLLLNFLVVLMISILLNVLHIQPYLQKHGLDVRSLLEFCLVWGMGGAFISLALSRIMAKWMMGVRVIDPHTHNTEERKLVDMVYSLAREANLSSMPQVGIFNSNEPNAFATGPMQSRSLVAVSSSLLERMSPGDLRGVLGHEISHIANGDMVTMTLLQGVVNAFVMFLSRLLAYTLSGLGRSREERGSYTSFMLFTQLFQIVFMILGSLLLCAYSRYREFRADTGGAQLAGRENMIGALRTLQSFQKIHDPRTDNEAVAAFKISRPSKKGFTYLFATHPPLEERIHRLQQS
ncbi:MAG: protease HtpX [Verrucomicrobiota bacterium]|nr:protease HtpX [Verrucomicrobiota bacterium]